MKNSFCIPRVLSDAQAELAARRSVELNPSNIEGGGLRRSVEGPNGVRANQRRLALYVGYKWPSHQKVLSVQFLDTPPKDLRKRILLHMNAWNKTVSIRFKETTGIGDVRIARLEEPEEMAGYWSYLGTQALGIDEDQPTMNLEGFTMNETEKEFRRVVRHEAGHALSFDHEHMREELVKKIDPKKAYVYFYNCCGWDRKETDAQVLTPLKKNSIMGTSESDPDSIMCYQIPAEITKDGKEIKGGNDINVTDYEFAGKVYPKQKSQELDFGSASTSLNKAVDEVASDRETSSEDAFHLLILDPFSPDGLDQRKRSDGARRRKGKSPKFVRVIASYRGARVTCSMRLRADRGEPPTNFGKIIGFHERIKDYTDHDKGELPPDSEMVELGGHLFETLFQGDVRRLYDEARARRRSGKLNIVLTSMISWIAEKPWEFAYDTGRCRFLATEEVHLIRNVLTAIPTDMVSMNKRALRILVVSAQPVGMGHLSIDQEVNVIRRGFSPLSDSGLAQVDVLARATPGQLHRDLATGRYNVVHFIGHGTFDQNTEEGALIFEDEHGSELVLGERSVREIFCQRGVSLVFLNACKTGTGGRSDFNKGVAQSLVAHGLPALVANQYSVLDSSATSFAQQFYWALAQGMSIGKAACEARIAVNYSLHGDSIDWAVPVVYAHDADATLCPLTSESGSRRFSALRSRERLTGKRVTRVAVWDIDHSFPALEQMLDQMNKTQGSFEFEVVTLSAPIDAWDVETTTEEGSPYLWAEKLVERLAPSALELRADLLVCVTKHWLRDNEWLNLYGWWPVDKKPPIALFSCAGFEELEPEGVQTNRALANMMVTLLSGYYSGMECHEGRGKKCPLYFDPERDFKLMIGKQSFDVRCATELKKRIPKLTEALDSLLTTFH